MWNEILGHTRQIEQIKKTLSSGRLPNAYLFTGPRGVGKRLVADNLAAAIACLKASSDNWDPCGTCTGCHKAGAGTHPDIFIVEPESEQKLVEEEKKSKKTKSENLKIEQIRELQSRLQYHPLEASAKVAIIDEADRMTESTANSLLKILEEPPSSTHFILISALPHLLLPTIRSRSQAMSFGPLPDQVISKYLLKNANLSEVEAARISKLSGGSLGTALTIDPEFINEIMGRFITLSQKASAADIMTTAESWSHSDPNQIRLIFDLLASWYRDCLRFKAIGDKTELIHHEMVKFASQIAGFKVEHALKEIEKARLMLTTTANKQLMFENLLFTLGG